jgi:hypothetical protein
MIKKILLILFAQIVFVGCNSKNLDKVIEWGNDYRHSYILENSTQIVIENTTRFVVDTTSMIVGNEIDSSSTLKNSNFKLKKYEANTKEQLTAFKNLFVGSEKTDYCCCPDENYSISFYHYQNNFDYYLVDTIEFKNKVRIYDVGYQYSYIIQKDLWKSYLKQLETKN